MKEKDKIGISSYLYNQLRHHKIIQDILDKEGDSAELTFKEYEGYISNNYSPLGLKPSSIHAYATRLLQWFSFSGLAYFGGEHIIISHDGRGKLKGYTPSRRGKFGRVQDNMLFLCASKYEDVIKIIYLVSIHGSVANKWAKDNGLRNAVYDAVALGILERNKENVVISEKYNNLSGLDMGKIEEIVKRIAKDSKFLKMLSVQLQSSKNTSEAGSKIALLLGRNWSDSSKTRYISSGQNWLKKIS